jgi:(4S)-4-hydroxy-5-phosphonooxypentane-2,3-dione isomerase
MSKLAISGTIEIQPDRREEFLPILKAHRIRCLRDEPGTVQFDVLVPRDDTTKVLLCEIYENDAAFDAHMNGASIARMRQEAAGMILKVSVTRCELLE